jgi:uncharacterized protein (TIGR02145 family)
MMKMKQVTLILTLLISFGFIAQAQTVTIGSQVWMTENLNSEKFRNGDPIPQAKTKEEWKKAGESMQPAWCYCTKDSANGADNNKLYNWYAVNDPRGLAPIGFHIPTDEEWSTLQKYLGIEAAMKMKSTSGWDSNQGNGTNSSGFTALPVGGRGFEGTFSYIGRYVGWWSSTEDQTQTKKALDRLLDDNLTKTSSMKGRGLSVRCLKN